jgi:aminoglycoside phosphotransferase (APT) family kinase protein
MPVPILRDLSTTEEQLAGWLAERLDGTDVAVSLVGSPADTGFSGETIFFTARWQAAGTDQSGDFVARVRPTNYTLYPSHDLQTQFRVLDALAATDVPVPPVVGAQSEAGSPLGEPFLVMRRVPGAAPPDNPPFSVSGWVVEASPSQQTRLYESGLEVLARVHAVDWANRGLAFLQHQDSNPVGIEAAMAHDEQFFDWVADGRALPEFAAAIRWLRRHLPEETERVLNWGDSRLGNILFEDFAPTAALDWEMVTLGDRAADLAWWLFFNRVHTDGIRRATPPGFLDERATIARYEELTGHRVQNLHFYLVRAALRGGLLLRRYADMLVARGTIPPDAARGPHTPAVRVLETLLS